MGWGLEKLFGGGSEGWGGWVGDEGRDTGVGGGGLRR